LSSFIARSVSHQNQMQISVLLFVVPLVLASLAQEESTVETLDTWTRPKLDKIGMPASGYASMTFFKDSDLTDCGKRQDTDRSFRSHGPLVAMNHFFYDQYYTPQKKQDQLWQFPPELRPRTGICNDLCYELTAKRTADGKNGAIPRSSIIVMVGDRCGDGQGPNDNDYGWCDADAQTPSSYTRKLAGPWQLPQTTFVHFDLMCMSLNQANAAHRQWLKYGLTDCDPTARTTNFLITFKRVSCSKHTSG
jgi:hypothetical protein